MRTSRHIRSFVLRAGRVTQAQERALAQLWPRYGIGFVGAPLDLDSIFGRSAPRCVEIGFGNGEVIAQLALLHPEIDYLGIEVHPPGVGRLLLRGQQLDLHNLRILRHDAVEVLRDGVSIGSIDEILIFFPDPWHKKRHHKRRLVGESFVRLLASRLRPGGKLCLATDWQDYAEQMLNVGNACPALRNLSDDGRFVARSSLRETTKFEQRGQRLGHGVWDLAFERRA